MCEISPNLLHSHYCTMGYHRSVTQRHTLPAGPPYTLNTQIKSLGNIKSIDYVKPINISLTRGDPVSVMSMDGFDWHRC